jgi:hypothetical protein
VIFNPQPLGTYWWLQPQDRSAELLVNGSTGGSTGAGLAGNGQVAITLGPTRHVIFKTQLINTSSAPNTSTFTNNSGVPITFTGQYYDEPAGIVLYGANATDFLLTTTCPVAPATLAAGASCTASVVYHPTIVGSETVTLAFFGTFSPGNGQQAVEFTASSTAVSVAPVTLTFPATTVGTSSASKAVVFKNAGSTALPISSVTIQGTDPKDFTQTNTCGTSVAAGVSCKFIVTFTPTATGTRTASLHIGDPDPTGPQIVSLTGTGQ